MSLGRTVLLATVVVLSVALRPRSSHAQDVTVTLTSTDASVVGGMGDHRMLIEDLQSRLDGLAGRLELASDQVDLLRETALGGDIAETRATITHQNMLGGSFDLEQARYLFDGGVLLQKVDSNGSLAGIKSLVLFDGGITPGEHVIEVEMICRGGGFGLFSYVESYRFRVSSRYVFKVREGRHNSLDIVLFQKPDITLEAAKRLSVRYEYEIREQAEPDNNKQTP